jgi:hypothetical protein
MLIPYHKHELSKASQAGLPIEEIIVGPTPHPHLAREAANALLSSKGFAKEARSSVTPYRAW